MSIWTALDGLSELGAVLFAGLDSARSSPLQHRRLVTLLRSFSISDLLSSKAKAVINVEHCDLFPATSTPPSHTLHNPIAELQSLLIDASPAAVAQIATFVLAHFLVYSNWGSVIIDGLVQLLPQLRTVEPAVSLLRTLQERGASRLDHALPQWIKSLSPSQLVSTFAGGSDSLLVHFLGELVSEGIVPAPTMVRDVLLTAWGNLLSQLTPAVADSQPLQLESTVVSAMEALRAVAVGLILPRIAVTVEMDVASPSSSPPQDPSIASLVDKQRQASRRASLFVPASLPALAQLLSIIVIRQEVFLAASRPDLAELTGGVFIRLAALPELQALVVRDPKALRTAMLEGEVVKSLPRIEALRPKLLAGVLLALKDGGAGTFTSFSLPFLPR
jgi:hypothetical protein